ncbi:hypothetical protein BMS3Bbin06_01492 [bacterium BMS3Bbin06]|nr:hypothetical protein BMS3Bbin06_01492 [bacterium BMS3Bbin06]
MLKRFCIIFMILIIMSLCPPVVSADGGVSYIGDLCLVLNTGSFGPPGPPIRLGVISYGGKYFGLQGEYFHGSIRIDDNGMIKISLFGTDVTYDFPAQGSKTSLNSMIIVIDPSTGAPDYNLIGRGDYQVMSLSWNRGWSNDQPGSHTESGVGADLYVCD